MTVKEHSVSLGDNTDIKILERFTKTQNQIYNTSRSKIDTHIHTQTHIYNKKQCSLPFF